MRRLVRWFLVSMVLVVGAAAAQDCPQCRPIEDWLTQNRGPCGYHGARLKSFCDPDPECVQWNRACNAKRDELRACIARCLAGELETPPQSQARELDEFDRDMAELERTGFDPFSMGQSPEWCRKKREEIWDQGTMKRGRIGLVVAASGDIEIRRCEGSVQTVVGGTMLEIGDCIKTGADGRLRVQMADRDENRNAGPSVINISRNAEMCFLKVDLDFNPDRSHNKSLIDLVSGAIRVFFQGWGRNDSVSIRTGVTHCGIRGSEVIIRREPSDGSVQVGVIDGHAWLGNRVSREIRYLEAGQWAQDRMTGMTEVQPMSRADWDRVVAQDGLDLEETSAGLSGPGCSMAVGDWHWVNGNIFALTGDGRWTITNGNGSGNWRCETNSYGDTEVVITPDAGDWWTRAVIAPDGLSLSGAGNDGVDADAVRLLR